MLRKGGDEHVAYKKPTFLKSLTTGKATPLPPRYRDVMEPSILMQDFGLPTGGLALANALH